MANHFKDSDDPFVSGDVDPFAQPSRGSYTGRPQDAPNVYYNPAPAMQMPTRKRRIWPIVTAVVLLVIIAVGGICAFRLKESAREVKANAQTAMGFVSSYVDAAKSGDSEMLEQSARGVSDNAHAIRDELQSPLWAVASVVPVVGSDVSSVRVLGDVFVDVADNALMPLAQNSNGLKISNLMSEGAVDVTVVRDLVDALDQAGPVLKRSAEAIEALPPAHLEQVSSVVDSVKDKFSTANDLIDNYGPLLPYLPSLLGENGETRTYLVLAENIAELHASGGFTGAVGTLSVTDGRITMGEFEGITQVMPYDGTTGDAQQEDIALFGDRCNIYSGDHNCVSDYSHAAKMYHDHWFKCTGQDVDGVLSFDPVFLQYMLGLVGGVETSFGVTVDGTNAAPYMLNKCLFWWDPDTCDAFYSEVSKLAFNKVLSGLGSVDTTAFFETVWRSANEGRCIAWLRDEGAQEQIEKLNLAWQTPHDASTPVLGLYVNDWTVSKGSYYLSISPTVGESHVNENGETVYPVSVTYKNNASRELLWDYVPEYLHTRLDLEGTRSELDLLEQIFVMGPEGGRIENLNYSYQNSASEPAGLTWEQRSYQGLDVQACYTMRLDAQESCVVTFDVVTSPEATEPLAVRTSPTMSAEFGGWAA